MGRRSPFLGPGPVLVLLAFPVLTGPARGQPAGAIQDAVPAYTLPDPLRFQDGRPVSSAADWREGRRPEVLRLFEEHVYGRAPARPAALRSEVVETDPKALGGRATRRQVRVRLDDRGSGFDILLYVPNQAPRPAPAFLVLNFGGNHTIHPDPGIRLSTSWVADRSGAGNHRANEESRGSAARSYPVERILDRGYALATVGYADFEPDHREGLRDGVRARFGPGPDALGPGDWGAIAAWAWGLSRALDFLETDRDVDARRVAVLGHSRLGKAALWAGARDERFAMVVSNNSGEGGAALARRRFGETVKAITTAFPHWFARRFREYADREDALPVDAHFLLALMAPRPLYVASASEDLWADPRGEFLAAKAAEPVFRLLGGDGLGVDDLPAPDRPVGGTIGYHLRRGPHDLTAYDWEQYLAFADRHLRSAAAGGLVPPGRERDGARDVLVNGAYATLFAVVGLLALVAGLRWRAGRLVGIWLGAALLQHAVNRLAGSGAIRAALGGPAEAWTWTWTVTNYFIAVPWALLVEQAVGPGWRSTVRRTWQVFAVCAVAGVLVDLAAGRPGLAAGPLRAVVVAGALVGFANVSLGGARMAPELRTLRVGYLAFMAFVMHDGLAANGLLPWRRGTGQLGLLVFVGCLAATAVASTLRGQRQLHAIEQEMGTARRIQASLLPGTAPRLEGATVAFRHVPATAVAGDLFDFLDPGPRRTGILVADVCGHGVPAALIASMVKVAAAAQKPHAEDPARVLAGIHLALAGELPEGRFVTAVYVHLDLDRGRLRHASAGHAPALVRRAADGSVAPAGPSGPLIVAIAPADYPVAEVSLAAGDRVLLYTDGVVEAARPDGEMYGEDRLSSLVSGFPEGPDALLSAVVKAASAFTGRRDGAFDDDCTLVAVEIDTPPAA